MTLKIKNCLSFAIVLLLCLPPVLAQVIVPSKQDNPTLLSINGLWKFKYMAGTDTGADSTFYKPAFDTGAWANIKVPGNWELQGFAEPSYGKKIKDGTGLYRTTMNVPANWKNQPVYIAFDGVEFGYTFWLNGKYAGTFASAFNRQVFDVSALVIPGKSNVLAVKVITHPKGYEFDTNDDWALSGISRSVTLFSLPPQHIKDVVVNTTVGKNTGSIGLKAVIEKPRTSTFSKNLQLSGQITDAQGKLVKTFAIAAGNGQSGVAINYSAAISIPAAKLWTAETPYLYTLKLSLKDGSRVLQTYTDKVGIRQITWADGVLKLNGVPVKLKGVTHHDQSPLNGRAITDAEIKRDLLMMRAANMNFVRTSHYPPNPRMLQLCDSLGIYVMDEVPFGFGEEHLNEASYLPLLLQRAQLTVWRDKNRPSVIVWSVGNENPVTDLGLKTGRYVKAMDPSRPYCFPQTPTNFNNMLKAMPDSIDLLDDHYPKVEDLETYAKTITKPMVASEYAHALGLDFNDMEAIYEAMYANPKFAGGAVWEFADQGILRKASKKTITGDSTFYAWASRDTIYDTSTNEGADGMVYANRVPQVDYWQARKVYTSIKALDEILTIGPGSRQIKLHITNRYDFVNLSAIKCKWQLYVDSAITASGMLALNCAPHHTVSPVINLTVPQKLTAAYYYLKVLFEDGSHKQVYEKVYPLNIASGDALLKRLATASAAKVVKTGNAVQASTFSANYSAATGGLMLKNSNGQPILSGGPYARVGRKPSMAQIATQASKRAKAKKNALWNQYILAKPEVDTKIFTAGDLQVHYTFKPDSLPQRSVAGDIDWHFSDSGFVRVAYNLKATGKEQATETGVSFLLPASLTEFRWVGKGPYAAYPGKDRLSEFGIYHLNSDDLYFPGNRQNVSIALFTDAQGNGLALIADSANISVERTAAGLLVSHNATVSQRFNKYEWPADLVNFADNTAIKGNFIIVPLSAGQTPAYLKALFGDIKQKAKPFKPFYHSYDQ